MTSILADRQYTLIDFNKIKQKYYNKEDNSLDNSTIDLINEISLKVGAPTYQKTPVFKQKRNKKRNENITQKDWLNVRNFKTTSLNKTKIGIGAEIDKIRSNLNKLTKTNYEYILKEIINITSVLLENEDEDATIVLSKISNVIFDIGSTNKFMSKYYARLYKDIIKYYPDMNLIINNNINKFNDSFNNYEFISSEEDYDKFCECNKKNEVIRSTSYFISDLMVENVIGEDIIINLLQTLENKINNLINSINKKNELEEIIENIKTLIIRTHCKLSDNNDWNNIVSNISIISKFKSSDYNSLSNKIIFKCADIIEEINDLNDFSSSDED